MPARLVAALGVKMLLKLLRHGVTEANLNQRFNGMLDDPLLESQRRDLERITFDSTSYDVIYCSPLRRALETASHLRVRDWIAEPRIAERHLGIFQGLSAQECRERYPDEFRAFMEFDADFRIPGGESRAQNLARVMDWLSEAARHEEVLAITHGGTVDFV